MTPKAKHSHVVQLTGPVVAIDVPALKLAMLSRGRRALAGAEGRAERDELAELLDGTLLAPVLRSGAPIRVGGVNNGWLFEEL